MFIDSKSTRSPQIQVFQIFLSVFNAVSNLDSFLIKEFACLLHGIILQYPSAYVLEKGNITWGYNVHTKDPIHYL